jgi:transcription antitermination factor NusG
VRKAAFEVGQLVRVRKGLYTGDLAKIHKIHKHRVDVLLVPRMNLQFIKE